MMIMKAHETMRMMVSTCMIAILLLSCCNDVVARNVDAVVVIGEGCKWKWGCPPPPWPWWWWSSP